MSLNTTRLGKRLRMEHQEIDTLGVSCANCGQKGRWIIGWSFERWFVECSACSRRWDGLTLDDAKQAMVADSTLRTLAGEKQGTHVMAAPFWRPGKVRAG